MSCEVAKTAYYVFTNINPGIATANLVILYLLFADDLIFFAETHKTIQEKITGCFKYRSSLHLIVNLMKTKILLFNHKGSVTDYSLQFGDETIKITTEYLNIQV